MFGDLLTHHYGGSRYFIIFVDNYSQFTWLYLLHSRSELPQTYYDFANMVKNQFNRMIKVFRSINAMEYKESTFLVCLGKSNILPHQSCPGTSQQNGHVKQQRRHFFDTTYAICISDSCPERFSKDKEVLTISHLMKAYRPRLISVIGLGGLVMRWD